MKKFSEWIAYLKSLGINVILECESKKYYENYYNKTYGYNMIITHDGLEGIRASISKRKIIIIQPFVTNSFENDKVKYIPDEFSILEDDRN